MPERPSHARPATADHPATSWLGGLLVFASALLVRAFSFGRVFADGEVVFGASADELYHLRRIQYTVERFPEVLSFDRYLNHPHGAEVVWPPAFDWSVAALARLLVGPGDPLAVERVVAWAPPLLGALTAVAVFFIARRHAGPLAGWLAGGIFAVLPAAAHHGGLGVLDHHVAVALLTAGLLAAAMATFESTGRRGASALALGLSLGGVVAVWPGALLHAALVQAVVVVWTLAARDAPTAASRAGALAVAHAVAALVVAPFALGNEWQEFGTWSPFVLCNLQPVWFTAGALILGLLAAAIRHLPALAGRGARVGFAVTTGALGVLAALLSVPELRDSLATGAGWFGEEEDFQTHVTELRSLFVAPGGELSARVALRKLSWLLPVFPLAWGVVAHRAVRGGSGASAVLALWSAFFFAAAVAQTRFVHTFSASFALVFGFAAQEVVRIYPRTRNPGLAALGLLLLIPSAMGHRSSVLGTVASLRGETPRTTTLQLRRGPLREVGEFVARATPETRGWLDPEEEPEYAVLSAWGSGHALRYYGRRPMVQDNFGVYGGRENFERSWRYFESRDEAEAVALLDEMQVRYVVADRFGAGAGDSRKRYPPATMAYRLSRSFGSETEHSPGLDQHRMVFHAKRPARRGSLWVPPPGYSISVFERVEGAQVEGRAEPNQPIEIRLPLRVGADRIFYLRRTRADSKGHYAIRLPYPTEAAPSSEVSAIGPYQFRAGDLEGELRLGDSTIRRGERIEGPCLESACG